MKNVESDSPGEAPPNRSEIAWLMSNIYSCYSTDIPKFLPYLLERFATYRRRPRSKAFITFEMWLIDEIFDTPDLPARRSFSQDTRNAIAAALERAAKTIDPDGDYGYLGAAELWRGEE